MSYPQQGHGPYGQQQYGHQQYGGYGPPPPQQKSNGPVIAVVLFVVVLLGGLGVTGFVAPGFFLSDDSKSADGGSDNGGGGIEDGPADPTMGSGDAPENDAPPATSGKSDTGGGAGAPDPSVDTTTIQTFLDAISAKDEAKATGMLCNSATASDVKNAISKGATNLKAVDVKPPDGQFQRGKIEGSLASGPIRASAFSVRVSGRNSPCVVVFLMS